MCIAKTFAVLKSEYESHVQFSCFHIKKIFDISDQSDLFTVESNEIFPWEHKMVQLFALPLSFQLALK